MSTRRAVLGLALALPFARAARAATPEIFAPGGLALGGTDPVAYFTDGRPVPGIAAESLIWRGATWRFAGPANRTAFEMDPAAYAPRYGGWCAWAVARGYTAATVPEAFTLYEGALYLNASLPVRRRWERDIPGNIARADANWPGVLG